MRTQTVSVVPAGTALSRYVRAIGLYGDSGEGAVEYAQQKWRDTPEVGLSLRAFQGAIDLEDATALKHYGIAQELVAAERKVSVVGRLLAQARRVPFLTPIPRETVGATAHWVASGFPIPVSRLTYGTNVNFEPLKIATIVPLTVELLRNSAPSADAEITRSVVRAIAKKIDEAFLDPTAADVAFLNPASVTFGATAISSTGGTDAQIETDLRSMIAALGSFVAPYWILKSKTAQKLATTFGANGFNFPNILGIPYIASDNSPAQITLLDADSILIADEGEATIDISREATIEMDDAPAQGETSPVTTISTLKSMWQNNLVAIRAIRRINWTRVETSSVVFMSVSY